MISSLLIANRGEIACRIHRTATAMGLRSVAVYSDADANALHVRNSEVAARLGPAPAAQSYLRGDLIIEAALKHGAQAIHPGYGFLAENAEFARKVVEAGLIFVGPPAAAIKAMGAKAAAKALMEASGVPVVPGYHGAGQGADELCAEARNIGYPVLIKASLGGGGKGMRRVDEESEFLEALAATKREAMAAFGDDQVIIERYILAPRHIEVQIFADRDGNCVHLYERDCSLQRRHQKVIEEAPAPGMTATLRQRMTSAAIAAARAVDYVGAGTVEFIVDGSVPLDDATPFYFMEMNTRLQVEHPVTESVTGFDLVEWQLRVASGETLPALQKDIPLQGHSVEARLYAEAPQMGFLPSTGPILHFRAPHGPDGSNGKRVRVDTGVEEGGEVSPHYDPMIAKVIASGDTRAEAIDRLDSALADFEIAGPQTNQAFLRLLLADSTFRAAAMDTGLIEGRGEELLAALTPPDHLVSAGVAALLGEARNVTNSPDTETAQTTSIQANSSQPNSPQAKSLQPKSPRQTSPWALRDGFQLGPPRQQICQLIVNGEPESAPVVWKNGVPICEGARRRDDEFTLASKVTILHYDPGVIVMGDGHQLAISFADPFAAARRSDQGDGRLISPMPGQVIGVVGTPGDIVAKGQILMRIEAMKMEHTIVAPFDGTLVRLDVASGDRVDQGDRLAVVEGHGADETIPDDTISEPQ